ncbi:helix-turn-helix domain-containing protein [Paenibacillus larvae]|nr:helix-turn-helix domain-containing protein [Paenibacillus larvae]MDT2259792.1 helix-turn-helix domain-containing protein [Paenibacillus larvae]
MKKNTTHYLAESKYKAVQMYLECGLGYKRVAKELNIPEASIRRWLNIMKMKVWLG